MSNLLRLLYVSRATDVFDSSSINDLLAKWQTQNAVNEVTGVLCSGRGFFVQAIEGLESRVLQLYVQILKDERHQQVSLLSIDLVSARAFSGGAMAHIDGNTLSVEHHTRLVSHTSLVRDSAATVNLFQSVLKSLRGAS